MKYLFFILLFGCSSVAVKKEPPKLSPYVKIESGIQRVCGVSQEDDGFEYRYIFDCKEDYSPDSRLPAGFGFRSKPGHPYTSGVKSPYKKGKVARSIDMISRNHALNETYLHVIDFAGGPDSHDWKSVIYLLPRTEIPDVKLIGNEVELLLPTGEKAIFDAETGALKGGALKEGPIDVHKDYMKRSIPNVSYVGDYISIRLDHRYDEPAIAAVEAVVQQKENTCRVPRAKLFNSKGKLLTKSDDELLAVLNQECAVPFKF